ncbi:MAG: hypothetical protein HY718_13140 [Planctomycetes bacterium]|nr:hypothetical protein [Planctomycetota bacterium]
MTPTAEPAPDFAAANEPRASARAEPRFSRDLPISDALRDAARSWTVVTALCLGVWLLVRMVFFVGLEGSDDMFYLRYA